MTKPIAIVTALAEELAPLLRHATISRTTTIAGRKCYVGTIEGFDVVLMAGGDGIEQASHSARALLDAFDASMLIGAGVAGGLSDEVKVGDIVVDTPLTRPSATLSPLRGARDLSQESASLRAMLNDEVASLPSALAHEVPSPPRAGEKVPKADEGATPAIITTSRVIATATEKRALANETKAVAVDTESSAWRDAARAHNIPSIIFRAILDDANEDIPQFIVASQNPDGSIDRNTILRHALTHPNAIPTLLRMQKRMQSCAEKLADAVVNHIAPKRLKDLLRATSRTFALCIPLLPQPLRSEITIAYLLFRIADNFEDASEYSVADRVQALDDFCALLRTRDATCARELASRWREEFPLPHQGYRELLAELPLVMRAFAGLEPNVIDVIASHVIRSAEGMSQYVRRSAGGTLQLDDVADLRRYCYTVAGIVGEMLTELFLIASPELAPIASFLRARAATFGEALQLVNILKDSAGDKREGRTYIPQRTPRSEVFALARTDLDVATEYTLTLQKERGPRGIVAFVGLPVALAHATLQRVETHGPGAKISRPEVFRITRRLERALARNQPALAFDTPTAFIPMLKRSLLGG